MADRPPQRSRHAVQAAAPERTPAPGSGTHVGNGSPGSNPVQILIVCTGNICRSPMAAGDLRKRLVARGWSSRFRVESAGTHGFRAGQPAHPLAVAEAARRGIDLSSHVSREITEQDLRQSALVLAMDEQNLNHLAYLSGIGGGAGAPPVTGRLELFTAYWRPPWYRRLLGGGRLGGIPDPLGQDPRAFSRCLDRIELGAEALLEALSTGCWTGSTDN